MLNLYKNNIVHSETFARFIFSAPAALKMISKSSFTPVNSGFSIIFALLERKLSFVQWSHSIKKLSVFVVLLLLSINANSQNTVIIKKLDKASCYHLGEPIDLMGKGFGSTSVRKYLVLQGGANQQVITHIKQWNDNKIVAQLPTTLTLGESAAYIVGIVEGTRWVSNRDKQIVLCDTPKKRVPVFKENPKREQPEASKPAIKESTHDARTPGDISTTDGFGLFQQRPLPRQTVSLNSLGVPPSVALDANKYLPKSRIAEPNEVVVVTAALDEAMALAQFVQQHNIRVKRRNNYHSLNLVVTVLHIPDTYTTADVVKQLRESYPELWIDFNHRYQLLDADRKPTSDPKHWAYEMLGWTAFHRDCQPRHKLGIIDTGIAPTDLLEQKNIEHKSLLSNGVKAAKKNHGTAIASLILGAPQRNIPGLLPNATLYSASIFRQRSKNQVDTSAELIVKALNWMADEQVMVINLSLGGPHNLAVEVAILRLLEKGFVVISAAGIDEQGEPLYPAAQEGVIAVRAIDANEQPFSKKIAGDYIDFSAPGVDLWLLDEKGGGRYLSGSSFAAPIVSARYALLNINSNTNDLLKNSIRDLGKPGKDSIFGSGLVLADALCQ